MALNCHNYANLGARKIPQATSRRSPSPRARIETAWLSRSAAAVTGREISTTFQDSIQTGFNFMIATNAPSGWMWPRPHGQPKIHNRRPSYGLNTAHCFITISSGHELNDRSQDTRRRASALLCNMIVEGELLPNRGSRVASVEKTPFERPIWFGVLKP
jgi:hypothetical protein